MVDVNTLAISLQIGVYFLTLWLGLYLLERNPRKPQINLAGWGLLAYAIALGTEMVTGLAPDALALLLNNAFNAIIYVPALLWSGVLLYLIPEESRSPGLTRGWAFILLPLGLIFLFTKFLTGFEAPWLTALLVLLPLIIAFIILANSFLQQDDRQPYSLIFVASIFFALATGLALFPLINIPPLWVTLAIGGDMTALGLGIAIVDAFDEGQRLRLDMLRSFQVSFFTSLLFGGQVVLAIILSDSLSFMLLSLLLTTIAAAVGLAVFANPLLGLLDRLLFDPDKREERDQRRTIFQAETRLQAKGNLTTMPQKEFARLTRRALSHFGDLPRLASSPLTQLPIIDQRLEQKGIRTDTLQRATELKGLLTESIESLKPVGEEPFNSADQWRHFNALYYPYVIGLKPYRRRQPLDELDEATNHALEWFRVQVPERTLYNWQNAAAELIAQNLQEQMGEKQ